MCSLRFENNFLTIEGVRFPSISKNIEAFVRFRFASVAITRSYNDTIADKTIIQNQLYFYFCF
jgi:hypothetical protein